MAVRRLLPFLRRYQGPLGLSVIGTAAASVLDGVTLVLLIPLLRHLFGSSAGLSRNAGLEGLVDRWLAPFLAGYTGGAVTVRLVILLWATLVAKNLLAYLAGQLSVRIQESLVRDLRTTLFGHLLRLDLGLLERVRGGQFIARVMHDADQTKGAVSASLVSFFRNLILVLTMLVVLTQLSWRLTALTLAAAPVLLIGIRILLRRLRRHARARAEEAGEMTATISERLSALKLIRAYGGEAREAQRFADQADRYRRQMVRTQRLAGLTGPVSELFGGLLLVILIAAGTSPTLTGGALSPASLMVFIVAALRVMAPLKAITQFPSQMAVALASADRVLEILEIPPVQDARDSAEPIRFERAVRFENIWFRYEGGGREGGLAEGRFHRSGSPHHRPQAPDWVLRDVSFTLPKGSVTALVGPSGAGKTTLAELLPRFREPVRGRILLDETPLGGHSPATVRRLLGFVGQETVILNDSVGANIAYGRPEASVGEIEAAARAAHAHAFISALPLGYGTVLGERGTRLSGGQRQRIAIARALLRDPPILILDEATSALDTESERLVQDALCRLIRDRTVLVIAHRLATVRHADQILVLQQGRIVERGTHPELLRSGPVYRRLYSTQFGKDEEPVGPVPALQVPAGEA